MNTIPSRTILFVTGAFVNSSSWDNWQQYFQSKGYQTYAPAWPFKDASTAELRQRHPDAQLAGLRLPQLLDHYARIAESLPEPPIIIGHSYGGLITQLLLQRGIGAAGIAIHSVPPQGVFTFKPSFYKATWGPLGFFTDARKPFMMSFPQWQYAFTNGMPLAAQKESYERYTIPESKVISRDALTKAAHVDFRKQHAPLLFMAGTEDHIMPASLNYSNYRKYDQHNGSVTEYKEFAGRNHYVLGQDTWQENAAYVLDWINGRAATQAALN